MPFELPDIRQAILDNGELSKEEILLLAGKPNEDWPSLRLELNRIRELKATSGASGGFRVRGLGTQRETDSSPPGEDIFVEAWQRSAGERLAQLLKATQLAALLGGKLANALRLNTKRRTGRDYSRLHELAHALVAKLDRDLFTDAAVRETVARACNVPNVNKWHPGKTAAVEFVRAVAFPREFAGMPADEPPEEYEYLVGRLSLRRLEPFQVEVRETLVERLRDAGGRGIVTLPTGAGKTRVAVDAIAEWLTKRAKDGNTKGRNTVLWLAHSGELCDQAYECFRQVWQHSEDVCPLLLFRFWARFTRDFDHHKEALLDILRQPSVLVSTPNRIVGLIDDPRERSQNVVQILLSTVSLIVVDEAHRAAAPSYRTIIGRLARRGADTRVIGLTATPIRQEYNPDPEAGTFELKELFRDLIRPTNKTLPGDKHPRVALQDLGVLAKLKEEFIDTATVLEAPNLGDPNDLTDDQIEKIDHALKLRADNPRRRQKVFDHLLTLCSPGSSIVYFGPSVTDAECMVFLLRQAGIPAAFVGGKTREASRRRIIMDFKSGAYRVLCNCEVLTTGFDAPKITHVVVARPTVSHVLYEQMIGRGLRGPLFGGTPECVVVNCKDEYRSAKPELGYQVFRRVWDGGDA